jgi:N-acetylglucosaminyldiphosphoundecaprenol N-acetyl-beta-D-mannosaminyltransferase
MMTQVCDQLSDRAYVLGTQVSLLNKENLLQRVARSCDSKQRLTILSGNIHSFNLAYKNQWLRDFFNQADIVRLDGAGLRLGAKLLGMDTPPRMTWADFAWDLAQVCEQNDFALFFLGAKPGVAEKAAQQLQAKYPRLRFVGIQDGYFNKEKGSVENIAVIQQINAAQPDILVVGFGMPLQERWLSQNWEELNTTVTLTGGAVFDYISGELQRAPKWMTDHGLEWLGRLLIEPRHLWKRYIVGNPLFLWRVLKQRLGLLKFD